jgi:hypothetical protein
MNDRGWQRAFADPILPPNGRKPITLRDAATFITKLPEQEYDAPEWQAAIEAPTAKMQAPESQSDMMRRRFLTLLGDRRRLGRWWRSSRPSP